LAKEPSINQSGAQAAVAELAQLRHFAGSPKDFWQLFLATVQRLTAAESLVLMVRRPGGAWRRLINWPAESPPSRLLTEFYGQLEELAALSLRDGIVSMPLDKEAGARARNHAIATVMNLPQTQEECVLAGLMSEIHDAGAREAAMRLGLAAPTAGSYQTNLAASEAKAQVEKFARALDLTATASGEKRFLATALTLCNGLAGQFDCERVSLGWLQRGFIRLRAISRTERFDPQMAAVRSLEMAMEEGFDQDEEIVWPPGEGSGVICRDHERFARDQNAGHVCSLPIRADGRPVAVVTCERRRAAFTETELKQMRLACDLVSPRLAELQLQDRWFGARWAGQIREQCARIIGPEHTWAKLLAVLAVVALLLLFCLRVPYRVEGNFLLRSDATAYLSAPFDGYIDQVNVRPGDTVVPGTPLLKLKTSELELEEAMALADLDRCESEVEKARAEKTLAEMRIGEALAEQARARLDLVRYHLSQASIQSPFPGVVIEGDLRERLGSPVKEADVLFRVARTDRLYVEAEVNERDVHEILGKTNGEIAFLSRPENKYPVRITAVEQAAVPREAANVFLVRCAFTQPVQAWWRPGMSGVCKFNVGKRTLFWILTHRTADFLRLKLWW
jgi:hypothetical protein